MRGRSFGAFVLCSIVATGFIAGIGLGARRATSEAVEDGAPIQQVPTASLAHPPFTAYAADEGALTFDQLDAAEQAAIVAQRNRDSSAALAERFEMMRAMTIARGEQTHAEVSASMIGLEGVATEGVVP